MVCDFDLFETFNENRFKAIQQNFEFWQISSPLISIITISYAFQNLILLLKSIIVTILNFGIAVG
jgi:hypothetical protein